MYTRTNSCRPKARFPLQPYTYATQLKHKVLRKERNERNVRKKWPMIRLEFVT